MTRSAALAACSDEEQLRWGSTNVIFDTMALLGLEMGHLIWLGAEQAVIVQAKVIFQGI